MNQEDRMWRAIIHVLKVDEEGVWLIIPGWNSSVATTFPLNQFPEELVSKFKEDYRFFALCNLGCEDPRLLKINGEYEFT